MTEDDDRFKLPNKFRQWLASEQLELLKQWPPSKQLELLKQWPTSKQLELLKRLARPGPAKPLSHPSDLQNAIDFVLKHRGDPARRQAVKQFSAWLAEELGTPSWNPAFRARGKAKRRLSKQQKEIRQIAKLLYPNGVPADLPVNRLRKEIEPHWNAKRSGSLPAWRTFRAALGRS